RSVRRPGWTKMLLFETGMKLASDTRTEYRPAIRPSKVKAPRSSVRTRSPTLSSALSSTTDAPICGTPAASVTRPRILPDSDIIEAAWEAVGRERRIAIAPSQRRGAVRTVGIGICSPSRILTAHPQSIALTLIYRKSDVRSQRLVFDTVRYLDL